MYDSLKQIADLTIRERVVRFDVTSLTPRFFEICFALHVMMMLCDVPVSSYHILIGRFYIPMRRTDEH
jgi:hypothetical protein